MLMLLLAHASCFAQNQGNIWQFGEAAVDFNSGRPTDYFPRRLTTFEGCASLCDTNGQLILYTDGARVWDKTNEVMPNGTGLLGHPSSTQAAAIVPYPGNPNRYYIFTTDFQGDPNGLRYTEVDITLNGGNGDVTAVKNIPLLTPVTEKQTVVKNAAGDGYWLIVHYFGNNAFYVYPITTSGIGTPVISNAGTAITAEQPSIGYLKASADGSRLLACNQNINAELFDFDTATGIVSNPLVLTNESSYSGTFSLSGNRVYITNGEGQFMKKLYQYDLTAADIPASRTLIYENDEPNSTIYMGAMQLGPDGKIYIARFFGQYLSTIDRPENLGAACGFKKMGFPMQNLARAGLPQFIESYFSTYITGEDTCLGNPTDFNLETIESVSNVTWDFGDSNSATGFHVPHTYAAPGNYTATATYTTPNGTYTKIRPVVVSPVPIIGATPNNQYYCGTADMNYDLGQFYFPLMVGQSQVTYHQAYFATIEDMAAHENPLPRFVNLPLGSSTTFYIKNFNRYNPSCYAYTSVTVTLNPPTVANALSDYVICESQPWDDIAQFDLSTKNSQLLGSQNPTDFIISYHPSQYDADHNTAALPVLYTNTLPQETLYARIQGINAPACFATALLIIRVGHQPMISAVNDFKVCDDPSNDGITNFDLSVKTSEILNGQSPLVFEVKYFYTYADALNQINQIALPINNTANNQLIYFSISLIGNTGCKIVSNFRLVVVPRPKANPAVALTVCDDLTNDGIGLVNLDANTPLILGNQDASQYTVSYHLSQTDADGDSAALPLNFQNTTNPQTIYARIENNLEATCFATTSFQIGVAKMPYANQPADLIGCDDDTNDGIEYFDLSLQNSSILGPQQNADFEITFYTSQANANLGSGAIDTNYANTSNPQIIHARVASRTNVSCYTTTSFLISVRAKPVLDLLDNYAICEGNSIEIIAPEGFTSYQWSNGSLTNITTITQAGNYSLNVTKDYGDLICESTKNITVYLSNAPVIAYIATQDWTDNANVIQINTSGVGDYEYSIDAMHYQDSPIFSGLPDGAYTVTVRDKRGCGAATEEVFLLMYPKFFTPNNDGNNDFWTVNFSTKEPGMLLYIFDRDGRLITGFNGLGNGWDGSFNGNPLPSSDYWFVIKRQNGKEYKGHFSLLR